MSPVLAVPQPELFMLFDYDCVKRALSDTEAFSSAVNLPSGKAPDWLIFTDPPRHTKLRALILRAFTPRSIAGLEPRIRELSRELLTPLIARGEMDLTTEFAMPLPIIVIAEMLGIPIDDRPRFSRWAELIANLSYAAAGGEEAARAIAEHGQAKDEMRVYLDELLDSRRSAPCDDLLSRLTQAEIDGERLSGAELLGFFQVLLAAGTETTTNLISNTVLCLHEHPAELARLRANPDLLPAALEEVLRFRSPVQVLFRETRREVILHDRTIPAGKFVMVVVGAANRDPLHFRDPDVFDITRQPNPHLAFGHGIHFCLGAALSRLEARVAMEEFLSRVDGFQLASDTPWPPRKALNIHGPASLPIRFTTRSAA